MYGAPGCQRQRTRVARKSAHMGAETCAPDSGSTSTRGRMSAPYFGGAGVGGRLRRSSSCGSDTFGAGARAILCDLTDFAAGAAAGALHASCRQLASEAAAAVSAASASDAPFDAEAENNSTVVEYAADIRNALFRNESLGMSTPDYMESQAELNAKMRGILVDWLVEVHSKYRMRPETLFLTVNIVDRYLSRAPVARRRLQLVGVVALLIASKFEEIDPPTADSLAYITDNSYSENDIFETECAVLRTLDFQIHVPTAATFLQSIEGASPSDTTSRELTRYILELGLLDIRMTRYEPSHFVASAVLLSNDLLGQRPAWPSSVARATRHSQASLRGCVEELRTIHASAGQGPLKAVHQKYSHSSHQRIAKRALGAMPASVAAAGA